MRSILVQRFIVFTASAATLAFAGACATPQATRTIQATELRPEATEKVKVDRALLLVDASGSIDSRTEFPNTKALVEAFVQGMPEGQYQTGVIAFGGDERESLALAPFSRSTVARSVSGVTHMGEDTRLPDVISEARAQIAGSYGDSAIILFSDGLPTHGAREQPSDHTIAAARKLLKSQSGRVCFHGVQIGDDPAGAALLQELAQLTPCGSTRNANSIQNGSDLLVTQRVIFLGDAPAPPQVAAAPRDTDRDGITNDRDRCPRTPLGAEVDPRGCWTLTGLNYSLDSSSIHASDKAKLDGVAKVLRSNPDLKIRIDGYTDSSGAETYNQALSERRAKAVQSYLTTDGIAASRLQVRGLGEANPVADNSTPAGRAENRRSELKRIE